MWPIILLYFLIPLLGFWRNFDFSGLNLSFFNADFTGFYFPDFLQGIHLVTNLRQLKPISDLFWDPYNLLGAPLIGAVDRIGIFYPVKFLFYFIASFFPSSSHLFFATYYSLFHLTLAGIFTYFFANRCLKMSQFSSFIAGVIYSVSGALLHLVVFTNTMTGVAFLPLQLYFLFQAQESGSYKRALLAGLAFSPILLAGYFPMFFYNNLFILLFLFFSNVSDLKSFLKTIGYLIVADTTAILLSLVVLLPNIEMMGLAQRQTYNLFGSSSFPFTPDNFLNYFIPHFYGVDKGATVFGYVGIASLLLIFLAAASSTDKRTKIFIFLALTFLILSLGNMTFLHAFFYKYLPLYGSFRRAAFLHYLVGFALSVLAGLGVSFLEKKKENFDLLRIYGVRILFIFSLFWFSLFLFKPFLDNAPAVAMVNEMINSSFITFIFLIASLAVLIYLREDFRYFKIGLVVVILIDLFTLTAKSTHVNSDYDPRIFNSKSTIVSLVEDGLKEDYSRAYFRESTLRYHSANEQIYQIDGYYGLTSKDYGLLMNYRRSPNGWIEADSPVLDILGVKYIFATAPFDKTNEKTAKLITKTTLPKEDFGRFLTRAGERVSVGTEIGVFENIDRLPRVYLVGQYVKGKNDEESVNLLDSADVKKTAVITTTQDLPGVNDNRAGSFASITDYQPSSVKINTVSNGRSLLVLSDSYFPGWQAYIDGKKTEIYQTNVALRGVFVEDGRHTIEFVYRPKSLFIGFLISGLTLVTIILLFYENIFLWFWRKR